MDGDERRLVDPRSHSFPSFVSPPVTFVSVAGIGPAPSAAADATPVRPFIAPGWVEPYSEAVKVAFAPAERFTLVVPAGSRSL